MIGKLPNFHTGVFFGPSSNCQWQPLFEEKKAVKSKAIKDSENCFAFNFVRQWADHKSAESAAFTYCTNKTLCADLFHNRSIRNKGHVFKKKKAAGNGLGHLIPRNRL